MLLTLTVAISTLSSLNCETLEEGLIPRSWVIASEDSKEIAKISDSLPSQLYKNFEFSKTTTNQIEYENYGIIVKSDEEIFDIHEYKILDYLFSLSSDTITVSCIAPEEN